MIEEGDHWMLSFPQPMRAHHSLLTERQYYALQNEW